MELQVNGSNQCQFNIISKFLLKYTYTLKRTIIVKHLGKYMWEVEKLNKY